MKNSLISFKHVGFSIISKLVAILILPLLFSSCSPTKSTVSIPANQQFILGDVEKSSFKADLENLSNKTVLVFSKNQAGDTTQSLGLAPKEKAKVFISRNETAILKNVNDKSVKVKARINKSVEGMRYEANTP